MAKSAFETLNAIDVGEHTEKKNNLTYLSWAWAWAEFKKVYPDATYNIWKNEQGMPYIFDSNLGYMVFTTVTVGDLTHSMWLPVMDNKNNAMKNVKYKVSKGKYTADVEPATMFDINTAIMRCLTKNLAMFGLGLYIYAGEDLPEDASKETSTSDANASTPQSGASTSKEQREWQDKISEYADAHGMTTAEICKDYHIGIHTSVDRLKEVYNDLASVSTGNANASTDSDMPDFEAIDEVVPFA